MPPARFQMFPCHPAEAGLFFFPHTMPRARAERTKSKSALIEETSLGIERLQGFLPQIEDLGREGFPYLEGARARMELQLKESIRKIFGEKSPEFQHYRQHKLSMESPADTKKSVALIKGLITSLEEKKLELQGLKPPPPPEPAPTPAPPSRPQMTLVPPTPTAAPAAVAAPQVTITTAAPVQPPPVTLSVPLSTNLNLTGSGAAPVPSPHPHTVTHQDSLPSSATPAPAPTAAAAPASHVPATPAATLPVVTPVVSPPPLATAEPIIEPHTTTEPQPAKPTAVAPPPAVTPMSEAQREGSPNESSAVSESQSKLEAPAAGSPVHQSGFDDPLELVKSVCRRFHLVARQLRLRGEYRATLDVEDEFDVQDLLHALLRLHFDDIETDEWVPSYSNGSPRIMFLVNDGRLGVVVKKTRTGLNAKDLAEQLRIDVDHCRTLKRCSTLLCFVYDPEGRIGNPRGLEADLISISDQLTADVFVAPK